MREMIAQRVAVGKAGARRRDAAKQAARVLGQPGTSLEPATRIAMERRLDFDFSRVRVHTGDEAAESARLLGAHAYTVGSHVVFADGAYAPARPDGRRLLAHELAHVVQSGLAAASGIAAAEADADRVATQVTVGSGPVRPAVGPPRGAVLRQDAGTAVGDVRLPRPAFQSLRLLDGQLRSPEGFSDLEPLHLTAFADQADPFADPAVDLAESALLRVLDPFAGTPEMASIWPLVANQVQSPKTERPSNKAPADLYAPEIKAVLERLGPRAGEQGTDGAIRRKTKLLDRLFQKLLTARNTALGEAADAGELSREFTQELDPTVQLYVDGGLAGYGQVRAALLSEFGALTVGSKQAFKNINDFYKNNIVLVNFLGNEKKVAVHKKMVEALDKTRRLLEKSGHADIARLETRADGVDIRWNVNAPLKLSLHSFGAAIDIDAEHNPNVPKFPVAFVKEVTGTQIPVTPEGELDWGELLSSGVRDRDPALETMGTLLGASKRLVNIFHDKDSLALGMWAFVVRSRANIAVPPKDLLAMVRAARSEGSRVRWQYQDPNVRLPRQAAEGTAHDALANLLFVPKPGNARLEIKESERRRGVVERLIEMADVFERSFARDKKGHVKTAKTGQPQRIKAEPRAQPGEAALPQLVAHGFASIPVELIKALRAPEGGNLTWLGTSEHSKTGEHTRDFMHFELKEKPPLPKAGPP
jgi:hypothetical protein